MHEESGGVRVKLAPQNGATVFLGNLDVNIQRAEISLELSKVNPNWGNYSIRLNRGHGFVNAFIDFPTHDEAEQCIQAFNGVCAFGSHYVRAELENTCASRNSSAGTSPAGSPRASSSLKIKQTSEKLNSAFSWSKVAGSRNRSGEAPKRIIPKPTTKRGTLSLQDKIYKLLGKHGGGLRLSALPDRYQEMYHESLAIPGNPLKLLVRMERLLLLNRKTSPRDVMVFVVPMPAYRLVVDILRSHSEGIETKRFEKMLEERLSVSLNGCDLEDFLRRWRFLTIKESRNGQRVVHFTPHSGSTVFFGNLTKGVTSDDIFRDLEKVDPSWRHASVRLKAGKGFSYAFVDFSSRQAAERAVKEFDGKTAFNSKYVSADIEVKCASEKTPGQRNGRVYTVFIGNLPESTTKSSIQKLLKSVNSEWFDLPIRLNLRSGWSHAFVDFNKNEEANLAISNLHNTAKLGSPRLRVELSKHAI